MRSQHRPSRTFRALSLPRRGGRGMVGLLLITLLVGSAAAMCQVWTRLKAIDCGYKISKASKQHAQLLEVNRRLKVELALLKSPARILRLTTGQMGLGQPRPDQIRRIFTDKKPRLAGKTGSGPVAPEQRNDS